MSAINMPLCPTRSSAFPGTERHAALVHARAYQKTQRRRFFNRIAVFATTSIDRPATETMVRTSLCDCFKYSYERLSLVLQQQ